MVSSSSASFDVTINNNTINKKISKGRQKIEIKKIEAKDSRQVTFSKRRTGLFKKAAELCVLTGARVAILVKSPGGKVYVFDEYDLIDGYLNEVGETGQLGFPEFNQDYDDVSQELVVYNRREMISSSSNSEESVDGMDIGQLEEYVCTPEEMKKDAVAEADELKMNKNEVVEASDSVVIDNSPAMLDIDLPLDMSWLDSDLLDMSWIDSFTDNSDTNTNDAFNLNFHHGVEV